MSVQESTWLPVSLGFVVHAFVFSLSPMVTSGFKEGVVGDHWMLPAPELCAVGMTAIRKIITF